ncbi:GNAT family N-acetyltransferase [Solirubrobacter phytolaccae]|uniref:GNAT family N-acetyltransferase n=1 Tax=Solirubrobacter phytolaccae TaxID=1404360 RepID=A0A9X3SE76_9ACTN|nr:GNAT family N-acetyltransferase [Solirubrobacter phytolaccae]MDA0180167.1 GNAT family N-acetyltransferase [Solirubrobacter phytolaccae]
MIRSARRKDAKALRRLDREVWSWLHSPVEPRDVPFDIEGVLVYELDGEIAGYVKVGEPWAIDSVRHVRQILGLAVDARFHRRGIATGLLETAIILARKEGARKLILRVLGHNAPARELYAACGFEIEGVLRDFFLIEGRYVDDVMMSLDLTAGGSSASS